MEKLLEKGLAAPDEFDWLNKDDSDNPEKDIDDGSSKEEKANDPSKIKNAFLQEKIDEKENNQDNRMFNKY